MSIDLIYIHVFVLAVSTQGLRVASLKVYNVYLSLFGC